jgi:hypothetical protein
VVTELSFRPTRRAGSSGRRAEQARIEEEWYHSDTILGMAMTLRLTEEEQDALRERASAEGVSMQDLARRAIRDYVARSKHRVDVSRAADLIMDVHAEAIERLGR